jgi:hypothetical protein
MKKKNVDLTEEEIEGLILAKRYLAKMYRVSVLSTSAIILAVLIGISFKAILPNHGIIFLIALIALLLFQLKEVENIIGKWTYLFRKPTGETIKELLQKLTPWKSFS